MRNITIFGTKGIIHGKVLGYTPIRHTLHVTIFGTKGITSYAVLYNHIAHIVFTFSET